MHEIHIHILNNIMLAPIQEAESDEESENEPESSASAETRTSPATQVTDVF